MTPSQFAVACGASQQWVRSAARALGWSLAYTAHEARHAGLVRQLQGDLQVPLEVADRLASEALHNAAEHQVTVGEESTARVTVDVRRYLSDFTVRLARASAETDSGARVRRNGEPAGAVARASSYGWDIGLLRASLASTPAERVRRLDQNMEFVRALRTRNGAGQISTD
jgi:hypothetical protein